MVHFILANPSIICTSLPKFVAHFTVSHHAQSPPSIAGALSLTLILIAFFLIEGIASIFFALDHRRELSGQWGWMLASGIVDLVLSGMLLMGLPSTAVWALGLLVGINMLFGGIALIAMALHARKEAV